MNVEQIQLYIQYFHLNIEFVPLTVLSSPHHILQEHPHSHPHHRPPRRSNLNKELKKK